MMTNAKAWGVEITEANLKSVLIDDHGNHPFEMRLMIANRKEILVLEGDLGISDSISENLSYQTLLKAGYRTFSIIRILLFLLALLTCFHDHTVVKDFLIWKHTSAWR